MAKIIPLELDTHFVEGKVNAFLVKGETVTLVDTGNPGKKAYDQLREKMLEHGVSLRDLDSIVLTHIHDDHAGAISFIQEEAELPVFVHEQARGWINTWMDVFERTQLFFHQFLSSCGADPEKHIVKRRFREEKWEKVSFLKDGAVIPLGGVDFEVVYVPGHSQSDILLWNRETGEAIAGDHLLKSFSVNAFIEPPNPGEAERQKPLLQYRNSLERVKKLPLATIFPGHGESFTGHDLLIEKRFQEQEKRCNQILHILSDGPKSIFAICQVMYPRLQ
ncbi:MBL fold metallo-hydrolase [Neobacillus sp. LXY-1]|uniref:MBL fold metallo-hydrolase n=1 Tax=Neobacillus sp. LXY-1 TaxID=3379133 RepID=UPI003EE023B9